MTNATEKLAGASLLSDSLHVTSEFYGPEAAIIVLLVTTMTISVAATIGIIIGTFQVFGLV